MKSIHIFVRCRGMQWLTRNCEPKVQLNLFLFRVRFMQNTSISREMETKTRYDYSWR